MQESMHEPIQKPMQGVILDADSLGQDIDLLPITSTLPEWQIYPYSEPHQVAERIQAATVVLTNKIPLTAAQIVGAPHLKFINVMATGTNNIDVQAALQQQIIVSNAVAYATPSVVQHTLTLMLTLATQLPLYQRDVQQGLWQQGRAFCLLGHPIMELSGKTLGIVGCGELGSQVAKVAEAFGMQVKIAARAGQGPKDYAALPLAELLPQVDILSLHCPLTPDTALLIDQQALALMKPSALLVNTARGGLVDSVALLAALRSGKLAGAAIDVLATEPPTADEPLLQAGLDNLIITPHTAWAALEARQRLVQQMRANIEAFLADKPVRRVLA
jgi:glycerate dehydrogenase